MDLSPKRPRRLLSGQLEPTLWRLFVRLSGSLAGSIAGGGVFCGAGGLGAKASNQPLSLGLSFRGRRPSGAATVEAAFGRARAWGAPQRQLHVCARLNVALRIKARHRPRIGPESRRIEAFGMVWRWFFRVSARFQDVLRFLKVVGLLENTQILEDQHRPLVEVMAGSEGDPVNNLLGPLGGGLSQEVVEEEIISEDPSFSPQNSRKVVQNAMKTS